MKYELYDGYTDFVLNGITFHGRLYWGQEIIPFLPSHHLMQASALSGHNAVNRRYQYAIAPRNMISDSACLKRANNTKEPKQGKQHALTASSENTRQPLKIISDYGHLMVDLLYQSSPVPIHAVLRLRVIDKYMRCCLISRSRMAGQRRIADRRVVWV